MAGLYSNYASASPADIQRKREIAQRLLMNAQQTQPQTIGEGLGAVGDYIYAGRVGRAAEAGDKELRSKGNAMLQALLGGGMQQEAPATPQPSLAPQGVNVAQIAPPAGAQGGNLPGTMPQVAPMQPEMPQQQMPQQQPKKGRFMFADVDTERLIELSMDPNVNQTLEYIGAGSVLKMANDEIKRRWDYMTEQEKQEFQVQMQERGFQHDFNKMQAQEGLPSNQASTALKQVQTQQAIKDYNAPGKAQQALDTEFAKDMAAWEMGGAADAVRQLSQLEGSMQQLQSGRNITGPVIGNMPDFVNAFFNPETMQVRDEIAEVTQRNLRAILGGQFAQKEGEQLIQRAFDPRLGEEVNRARLAKLMEALRQGIAAKQSAMQHFREYGTLDRWQGRLPTMQDFRNAVDSATVGAAQNKPMSEMSDEELEAIANGRN